MNFRKNIRRGQKFEAEEKAGWNHIPRRHKEFESQTAFGTKCGRIDIKIDESKGYVTIIEIKATEWDRLMPHRIRPTAQRHACQIWRYISDYVDTQGRDVCPALVYEFEPKDPCIRKLVEQILSDRLIQVVWRKETQL